MRLIDVDKLNLWTALRPYCSSDVCCEVTDIINNAPTVNPYELISVEDRLPEEKGEYLVAYHPCWWDDVKYDENCVGMDSFRGKTSWAKKKFQRVTHWMPLPTPPTEKEN